MTLKQYLSIMVPVEDIDYKVCIVDFTIGVMETCNFDSDSNWNEFVESIDGNYREIKSVHLSSTNNDGVVISIALN